MATVDTENYFAIAISDDLASGSAAAASTPSGEAEAPPQDDKTSRKAKRDERIAEAVRRSRVEYTPENVYTERGWFLREEDRGVQKTKIDQQRLEFLTASLYYSPETNHHDLLSKIMGVFEEDKASGGLPKELLDIGIRSALKAGEPQEAVRLARTGKGTWKTQWAGAACIAHDAFVAAGEYTESLVPLVMCMSISGPQYPLLTRLSKTLSNHPTSNSDSSQIALLRTKIDNLIQTREKSATRPLSSNDKIATVWTSPTDDIDSQILWEEIGCEGLEVGVVEEMVRRLDKASRTAEEVGSGERGVRQL